MSSLARNAARSMRSTCLRPGEPGRQIREGEAGLAEDADEQVVEVVRDAAGQHAEAFEALRLLDAIVERPPFALGAFPFQHLVTQGGGAFVDEALQVLLVPPQAARAANARGRRWPGRSAVRASPRNHPVW